MEFNFLIVIICSYVIGSIPSGLVLGKGIWHVDLREHGSKNIGATNAWRTLGKFPGFVIFLADLIKGLLGVYLGMTLVGSSIAMILGGILAIVRHSASTGLCVLIMLMPKVSVCVFFIWLIIVMISKYVSLASIVAAAFVPILAYAFDMPMEFVIFGIVAAIFVIYRHKTNIVRLLNGNENKIKAGHR